MTCLEKFRQDNPDLTDNEINDAVRDFCPIVYMADPDWCDSSVACVDCWNREIPDTKPTVKQDPQPTETVNHPKHYGREGAMECIDEMVLVFGVEATMHFCLLNAWKYRYRAADKGGEEDVKKSDWYMAKYAELKGVI